MSRPTKYTPDRAKKICDLLRAGNSRKCAAEAAGVCYASFLRWTESKPAFREDVVKAEAEAEALYVTIIAKAAREGDWRAAESWLKRRRRAEWGDSVTSEISGPDGNPLLVSFNAAMDRIYGAAPNDETDSSEQ